MAPPSRRADAARSTERAQKPSERPRTAPSRSERGPTGLAPVRCVHSAEKREGKRRRERWHSHELFGGKMLLMLKLNGDDDGAACGVNAMVIPIVTMLIVAHLKMLFLMILMEMILVMIMSSSPIQSASGAQGASGRWRSRRGICTGRGDDSHLPTAQVVAALRASLVVWRRGEGREVAYCGHQHCLRKTHRAAMCGGLAPRFPRSGAR